MTSNLDVLPTLAEWAKAPLSKGRTLDGQSSSLLPGKETKSKHREIYYVNNGICEAVRQGGWKYRDVKATNTNTGIVKQVQESNIELFNLAFDPNKRTNVIDECPEIVRQLKA